MTMEAQSQPENDRRMESEDGSEEDMVRRFNEEGLEEAGPSGSGQEVNAMREEELANEHRAKQAAFEKSIQESLSPIDKQHAPIRPADRRIHILGTGSIGKLVAHALKGIPDPPPITLLFHRHRLLNAWNKGKKVITVADGDIEVPRGGYDVELLPMVTRQHGVEIRPGAEEVWNVADSTGTQPHRVAEIMKANQQAAREAASREESEQEDTSREASDREEAIHENSVLEGGQSQPTAFQPLGVGNKSEPTREPFGSAIPYVKDEIISNLIVTTKTVTTVAALTPIKHRLNRDSTICFLQNGMGIIQDINEKIFPDEATRPTYVQGVLNHGANTPPEKIESDPFYVIHAGHGTISLGILPREDGKSSAEAETSSHNAGNHGGSSSEPVKPAGSRAHTFAYTPTGSQSARISAGKDCSSAARYIIRTLTRTPVLAAVSYTPLDLLQLQLEKLAVNSILNPLTALLDGRNGTVLANFHLLRTARMLLAETSLVMRSLPELRHLPNIQSRFSASRLESLYLAVAQKTAGNVSSMLADVRAGRRTEVQYINGYIVKRGEELGIKCVVNYSFMQMVMGKRMMVGREQRDDVPVLGKQKGLNPDA